MQEEIELYCKVCRKSFKTTYYVTGDDNSIVLENLSIKCHHHPRVLRLKKYTEAMLKRDAVRGRVYM